MSNIWGWNGSGGGDPPTLDQILAMGNDATGQSYYFRGTSGAYAQSDSDGGINWVDQGGNVLNWNQWDNNGLSIGGNLWMGLDANSGVGGVYLNGAEIYGGSGATFADVGGNWEWGSGASALNTDGSIGIGASGSNYGAAVGVGASGSNYGAAVGYYASGPNYGTAVGYSANGGLNGVAVGHSASGYQNSVAVGYNTLSGQNGVAVGYSASGYNNGVAVGYSASGYNGGAAVGHSASSYNQGVAVGYNTSGSNYGAAVGYSANTNGNPGSSALGYNAIVPSGFTDTAEIGQGTASLSGGLNYRGVGIVDSTGHWYTALTDAGPTPFVPGTPLGFLEVNVNGTLCAVPYYTHS